jgi:hypothetical protein
MNETVGNWYWKTSFNERLNGLYVTSWRRIEERDMQHAWKIHRRISQENLRARDHLKDIKANGRIILKMILEGTELDWSHLARITEVLWAPVSTAMNLGILQMAGNLWKVQLFLPPGENCPIKLVWSRVILPVQYILVVMFGTKTHTLVFRERYIISLHLK